MADLPVVMGPLTGGSYELRKPSTNSRCRVLPHVRKAVCTNCTRQVMGVIYCENCRRRERDRAHTFANSYPPAPDTRADHPPGRIPRWQDYYLHLPFGVGAVYTASTPRDWSHLVIFILLIVGPAMPAARSAGLIFGLRLSAFYIYQIIDAVKSAKAIQVGQTRPDPFGLGTMFIPAAAAAASGWISLAGSRLALCPDRAGCSVSAAQSRHLVSGGGPLWPVF